MRSGARNSSEAPPGCHRTHPEPALESPGIASPGFCLVRRLRIVLLRPTRRSNTVSKPKLKPLNEQVIVITGASSGIGLATAETAAKKGAKVVVAARSDETLEDVVDRITASGGEAIAVHCDVSDRAQVEQLARAAIERFGRIDTWVNNAGLGMYARLDQGSEEDARR